MRRWALALALLAAGAAGAQTKPRLEVVEMDPEPPAKLRTGDAFYARVLYVSDQPIRIFGRPKGGDSRRMTSHASPLYPAGAGEALVWFSFDAPGAVQGMRVEAHAGATTVAAVEAPLALEWTAGAPARTNAAWVDALRRDQMSRMRAPPPGGDDGWLMLFVHLMFYSVPAYLLAQAYALWRMRGRWNVAVWLPAIFMAAMYAWVVFGVIAGSNIVPIVLVFTSPIALLYVLVLLIVDLRRRTN